MMNNLNTTVRSMYGEPHSVSPDNPQSNFTNTGDIRQNLVNQAQVTSVRQEDLWCAVKNHVITTSSETSVVNSMNVNKEPGHRAEEIACPINEILATHQSTGSSIDNQKIKSKHRVPTENTCNIYATRGAQGTCITSSSTIYANDVGQPAPAHNEAMVGALIHDVCFDAVDRQKKLLTNGTVK